MSQISKRPKGRVVLTYREASGEVSELSYKSLLYFSSNGSYCSISSTYSVSPEVCLLVRDTFGFPFCQRF